jgi:nicotinate-nucleotide adenylyltransferase
MGLHDQSTPLRIGFFGGSFDPVHNGHVSLANQAIEHAQLDRLLICPAFHAPLRPEKPFFSASVRLKIIETVTQLHPRMEICKLEIDKQETCYTYNTIKEIKAQSPRSEIVVLLGEDQFSQLNKWKFHHELVQICQFLVFSRNEDRVIPPSIPDLSYTLMKNELIDCSSTVIRNRIQSGKSVSHLIPDVAHPLVKLHSTHLTS